MFYVLPPSSQIVRLSNKHSIGTFAESVWFARPAKLICGWESGQLVRHCQHVPCAGRSSLPTLETVRPRSKSSKELTRPGRQETIAKIAKATEKILNLASQYIFNEDLNHSGGLRC